MILRLGILFAVCLLTLSVPSAKADACPSGQVKTGFLDGHVGTEACVPEGDGMVDVTPEESTGDEGYSEGE